jgi:hypothetical protein
MQARWNQTAEKGSRWKFETRWCWLGLFWYAAQWEFESNSSEQKIRVQKVEETCILNCWNSRLHCSGSVWLARVQRVSWLVECRRYSFWNASRLPAFLLGWPFSYLLKNFALATNFSYTAWGLTICPSYWHFEALNVWRRAPPWKERCLGYLLTWVFQNGWLAKPAPKKFSL